MKKVWGLLASLVWGVVSAQQLTPVQNLPAASTVAGTDITVDDNGITTQKATYAQVGAYINGLLTSISVANLFGCANPTTQFLRGDGQCVTVTGSGGGVSNVSGVSANGFNVFVANQTTTPTITVGTSVNGILVSYGGALGVASLQDFINFFTGPCNSGTVFGGGGACVSLGTAPGQLLVLSSGDTTGATDRANLVNQISTLASGLFLPSTASQYYPKYTIKMGPGPFYITQGGIGLLSGTPKIQGVLVECSGRGVTDIDYNPSTPGPLFVNNHGLDLEFKGCTFGGHSSTGDWKWNQEQAGLSNIQDYTAEDNEWTGTWGKLERLTGSNNNSEWKFTRDTVSAGISDWIYVPNYVTATITSGSSSIAATINNEQVEIGDTGGFSSACAPLSANTSYYVVAATTTTFQVATSSGGTPVTFAANCTANFQTGSDQFLNIWMDKIKFDTGSSLANWINMAYGGSIKITNSDVSAHAPSAAGSCLFNLGNSVHAGGVENFSADGLRIEHSSNYSCTIISNWWRGEIVFNNLDESSQVGNRPITQVYATYNITNAGGPTIKYTNSQLAGVHSYNTGSNNYNYQEKISYDSVTLMDNPTFANFISMSGTNTGGWPVIDCDHCKNNLVASTVGYHEIVDTSLNWQYSGGAVIRTRTASCLGAQSNYPISGGSYILRLPLNAEIVDFKASKPANTNTGAFQYTVQSTESTPTLVAGGPGSGLAGTNAGAVLPIYTAIDLTPFIMTTDAARTIGVYDTLSGGRTTPFLGATCLIDYIG